MTQQQNLPADWAIEEAAKRSGNPWVTVKLLKMGEVGHWGEVSRTVVELARMIEQHEKPPLTDAEAATNIIEKYFSSHVFRDKGNGFWAGTVHLRTRYHATSLPRRLHRIAKGLTVTDNDQPIDHATVQRWHHVERFQSHDIIRFRIIGDPA